MHIDLDARRYAAAVYDIPAQAAWRVRLGGRYLLALQGVGPQHGSIELLEAHAAVVQEQPALADVRLVFAGLDPEAPPCFLAAFAARADELGTAAVVLADVEPRQLPALVAGASACVHLPTAEDDCACALDALAAGVPVVARDIAEVRDLLGDVVVYGDTVLSIADAIVDVLTDPPQPAPGVALARARDAAGRASEAGPSEDGPAENRPSEDGVVQQQPDRGNGREE